MVVSIDANSIKKSGFECLKENGFILNIEDVYISLQENTKPFIMTATAKKDKKNFTFKMSLEDDFFVCVEDDSIKLDMKKYKNDITNILKTVENTTEKINNRTSKDWIDYYSQNILEYIELNTEEPNKYQQDILREIESLAEYIKASGIKHNLNLTGETIEELSFFLPPEAIEILRDK